MQLLKYGGFSEWPSLLHPDAALLLAGLSGHFHSLLLSMLGVQNNTIQHSLQLNGVISEHCHIKLNSEHLATDTLPETSWSVKKALKNYPKMYRFNAPWMCENYLDRL